MDQGDSETLVAAYDRLDAAERAQASLVAAGVPEESVSLLQGEVEGQTVGDQLLGAFMSLFQRGPASAASTHAMPAGHVLVVVHGGAPRARIVALLEQAGPVELATGEGGAEEEVGTLRRVHVLRRKAA